MAAGRFVIPRRPTQDVFERGSDEAGVVEIGAIEQTGNPSGQHQAGAAVEQNQRLLRNDTLFAAIALRGIGGIEQIEHGRPVVRCVAEVETPTRRGVRLFDRDVGAATFV